MKTPNWYQELAAIDCSQHTEKKNGLTYLSWAWAWDILKKHYPLSYATVYESPEGNLYWRDPIGAHVKTGVTIVWIDEDGIHEHEAIEYLPIMDFKNKAKSLDTQNANCVDAMDINKTIQRSMTKCIARLGLGMYIYAGEDLPEETDYSRQQKEEAAKAEAEKNRRITELVDSITSIVSPIVSAMSKEEKADFARDKISAVIGQANYKACKDVSKLEMLLASLNNEQ